MNQIHPVIPRPFHNNSDLISPIGWRGQNSVERILGPAAESNRTHKRPGRATTFHKPSSPIIAPPNNQNFSIDRFVPFSIQLQSTFNLLALISIPSNDFVRKKKLFLLPCHAKRTPARRAHTSSHSHNGSGRWSQEAARNEEEGEESETWGIYSGAACPTSQYYTTPFSSYCSPPIKTKSSHAAA